MTADATGLTGGTTPAVTVTTLTAGNPAPTIISNQPISGNEWDFYMDDAAGDVGVTKLETADQLTVTLPDKYVPFYIVDSSKNSYADVADQAIVPTASLQAGYETQMQDIYAAARANNLPPQFLRAEAVGAAIAASGQNYKATIDMCLILGGNPTEQEIQGAVFGYSFPFQIVDDPTWGYALRATFINDISAL